MCKRRHSNFMMPILVILALIQRTWSCGGRTMLRASGVSHYEQQTILDMHNHMRQSVALGHVGGQPPAANMKEMKWDNELASRAQQWATTCSTEKHDHARHVSRFPVGQNLATMWTTKTPSSLYEMDSDFPDAISKWFDEFKYFRYGRVGHGSTGHYTQMIWADTNLIGCGYAFFYDPRRGFTKTYVCNYGPSGNVIGSAPYKKGYTNCVDYGMVDSVKYHGLCDKPSYYFGLQNYLG